MASPQGKFVGIHKSKVMKEAGDMNDQTEVFDWVHVWYETHADVERWERENTPRLPFDDGDNNVRHPHEVSFPESRRVLGVMYMCVIVRTANAVPGAVVTADGVAMSTMLPMCVRYTGTCLPLRRNFVAANVATLAV